MHRLYLAGALCLVFSGDAFAAGDAAAGAQIAERWCTSCHAAGAAGSDAAPPFIEIVKRPGRSDDYFYVWLTDPHPPMPRLDLSRQEIGNLIAYLRGLPGAR